MTDTSHKLYVLEPGNNRIFTCNENGEDVTIIKHGLEHFPDGIFLDENAGVVYFTQMGEYDDSEGTSYGFDGSIWRMNLDGSGLKCLVEKGKTRTPKQIKADLAAGKLYWCDREGMRIMRCNLDGSELETLLSTGTVPDHETDQSRWCVGIAIDRKNGYIYWSQKGAPNAGQGSIRRMKLDMPAGTTPERRDDVEVLFDHLPEPIDLDLDLDSGHLHWTDRGSLPGGNSVCRARINPDNSLSRTHDVIVEGTKETIGVTFDHAHGRMFITSITGDLYRADIKGGKPKNIGKFGALTGLVLM